MYSMVYYICDAIALDLLTREVSMDIWENMLASVKQLFSFLKHLEQQTFQIFHWCPAAEKQETLQNLISSNDYGASNGFQLP